MDCAVSKEEAVIISVKKKNHSKDDLKHNAQFIVFKYTVIVIISIKSKIPKLFYNSNRSFEMFTAAKLCKYTVFVLFI